MESSILRSYSFILFSNSTFSTWLVSCFLGTFLILCLIYLKKYIINSFVYFSVIYYTYLSLKLINKQSHFFFWCHLNDIFLQFFSIKYTPMENWKSYLRKLNFIKDQSWIPSRKVLHEIGWSFLKKFTSVLRWDVFCVFSRISLHLKI